MCLYTLDSNKLIMNKSLKLAVLYNSSIVKDKQPDSQTIVRFILS